jgi:hypothetical protein
MLSIYSIFTLLGSWTWTFCLIGLSLGILISLYFELSSLLQETKQCWCHMKKLALDHNRAGTKQSFSDDRHLLVNIHGIINWQLVIIKKYRLQTQYLSKIFFQLYVYLNVCMIVLYNIMFAVLRLATMINTLMTIRWIVNLVQYLDDWNISFVFNRHSF